MSPPVTAAKSLTSAATVFGRDAAASVNDSATFHFVLDGTIQTLSTHNTPEKGPIKGLMFVPSLDEQDVCSNITAPLIPANVTRHSDVEKFGYRSIGLAPWVGAGCARSFLDATQRTGSDALVFFLPSDSESKPPPPEDPLWSLGDGAEWKRRNQYPVYAIPGPAGATLMSQLASYSGNTSNVQGGHNDTAASVHDQHDTRLFTLIDFERSHPKMPSLWGFILAILGTVLVLSMIILLCYQLVQKRRRDNLQHRIESGEADMEQLGLHLLKVPQEILDTLPVYKYPDWSAFSDHSHAPGDTSMQSDELQEPNEKETRVEPDVSPTDNVKNAAEEDYKTKESEDNPSPKKSEASTNPPTPSESQASIDTCDKEIRPKFNRFSRSQTTCAICLDDFVSLVTTVRELPCGHLFHVDCIDASLTRNSCLCPLCKKSVLPPGYYPMPITNRVVHRDFMMRRTS
ncbi:hypothetical protein BDV25DRAFT_130173 [Aspergillus avenaceus]|uniref:RING-type domain-containing protein n=1 Tax=Aspergillus avenaceus TaxID=36643 RepID=A0A5N6TU55_ASPAV|nr:hypothetical protein BDV25DRAFT_130173 [Aspergillus avenaceus]